MSYEINLRGVISDNINSETFNKRKNNSEIQRIGKKLAIKLAPLVEVVKAEDFFPGFIFWESDNLVLNADNFFFERISFGHDADYDFYSLSILGLTNRDSELFNGWDSDLQVAFRLESNELKFAEAVFLGQEDHRFGSVSQFEISVATQLQIMHIADRAMNIFTRMSIINRVAQY